jgi:hypothetical protein
VRSVSNTGSHDAGPQARANTKAGLGRQVATHLLVAPQAGLGTTRSVAIAMTTVGAEPAIPIAAMRLPGLTRLVIPPSR